MNCKVGGRKKLWLGKQDRNEAAIEFLTECRHGRKEKISAVKMEVNSDTIRNKLDSKDSL